MADPDGCVVGRAEGSMAFQMFCWDEFLFYLASISADFLNVDRID